jgi:choice-of-anchor A domain-containing protein
MVFKHPFSSSIFGFTVGGNILFKRDESTTVMDRTPLGGDVLYGGTFQETGDGSLVVKAGRQIYQGSIDTQYYLDLFAEAAVKSSYWAHLQPNGIITPALAGNLQNTLTFSAGDDNCIQVFHADRFDLYGNKGIDVYFDPNLEDKTILINVASTFNEATQKREVHINQWGKIVDTDGGDDMNFKSRTKASILWNFYDAEVVTLGPDGGVIFPGSVLIPDGDLFLLWPGQDGRTIVGGDVTHDSWGSEFHSYEFDPPCPLPFPPLFEPPSECKNECVECPEGQMLVKRAVRQEKAELCDPLAQEDVVLRFKVEYVNECSGSRLNM